MADFFCAGNPLLTVMIQSPDPDRAIATVRKAIPAGAEAFAIQADKLKREHQNPEAYKRIFQAMQGFSIYATYYRNGENTGKTDEELASGLIDLARSGASLVDVMADYFDPSPDELSMDPGAIQRQKDLIGKVHACGAKVLMSSHACRFLPAERVLAMALAQQSRGADYVKIVTGAQTVEEEVENLRITHLLHEHLAVPFLFLSSGRCKLHRRIGPLLGCSMYLCVYEHDALSTSAQPVLSYIKAVRDHFEFF
jgi:3-dehydroquinate dehydratase